MSDVMVDDVIAARGAELQMRAPSTGVLCVRTSRHKIQGPRRRACASVQSGAERRNGTESRANFTCVTSRFIVGGLRHS